MRALNVALLQADPSWHDPAANRRLFAAALDDVDGADLVLLPEMFSTGFTMQPGAVAETMAGDTVGWLREQAAGRGFAIAGSVVIEDDGRCYNRLLLALPDGDLHHYDKRHLFRMAGEHEHYAPGGRRVVVTLHGWRLLLSVCYDLRFPVWLRCVGDYDALLCVANWPAARQLAWQALLRARAIENQCYVVAVNRIGVDGNRVAYRGGSVVFDPQGDALAEAGDGERKLAAVLDGAALAHCRASFPAWRDADRFQLEDSGDPCAVPSAPRLAGADAGRA